MVHHQQFSTKVLKKKHSEIRQSNSNDHVPKLSHLQCFLLAIFHFEIWQCDFSYHEGNNATRSEIQKLHLKCIEKDIQWCGIYTTHI